MAIYDDLLAYLKNRKIIFVDRFIPFFLCSFGAHILNLHNQRVHFYYEHDSVPSLRLPIMFIAPPGYSKSLFLRHLLDSQFGILSGAGVPTLFRSYMTEAALVGSYTPDVDGTYKKITGIAEKYNTGILGVEEYAVMTSTGKQRHSLGLEYALLHLLADGVIHKSLRSGEIEYVTNLTMWAGTQFGRFDLKGGFGRRIFFLSWVPTEHDENLLRQALKEGLGISLGVEPLNELRSNVHSLIDSVAGIEKILFTEEFFDQLSPLAHHEQKLFLRLGMGYHVMKEAFDNELLIDIDDDLTRLINQGIMWRREIVQEAGSGTNIIVQTLKQQPNHQMYLRDLVKLMLRFDLDYETVCEMLQTLRNQGRIRAYYPPSLKQPKGLLVKLI